MLLFLHFDLFNTVDPRLTTAHYNDQFITTFNSQNKGSGNVYQGDTIFI